MERQRHSGKKKSVAAYEAGPESNVAWLHAMVPEPWTQAPESLPDDRGRSGTGA